MISPCLWDTCTVKQMTFEGTYFDDNLVLAQITVVRCYLLSHAGSAFAKDIESLCDDTETVKYIILGKKLDDTLILNVSYCMTTKL